MKAIPIIAAASALAFLWAYNNYQEEMKDEKERLTLKREEAACERSRERAQKYGNDPLEPGETIPDHFIHADEHRR